MKIPYHQWRELPQYSGVYCIWNNNCCLYVGSSKNINQRFKSHSKKKTFSINGATHIEVFPFPEEKLGAEETAAIYRYQPKLNGIVGRPRIYRSTNTIAVRYILTKEDANRMYKVQAYLAQKFKLGKVSQHDAMHHMLDYMEKHMVSEAAQ